ncbi:two pore channel protein 1-like isoform X2 [Artemia franciscana]|uniref:two pore channel protein 1-like isoform X2 n=1 Tax=Artemia franciscana TaxID=6661 RepID=UPI0032DAC072
MVGGDTFRMNVTSTDVSPYARFAEDTIEISSNYDGASDEDEPPLFFGGMTLLEQDPCQNELVSLDGGKSSDCRKAWELNYHEAAIYLEEGINNDKFASHPKSQEALPAYLLVHNHWYYFLDFVASLILMLLALTEKPAHPVLELPIGIHGSIELLSLMIIGAELIMKLRWLGMKTSISHTRTALKGCALFVMLIEAIVILVRQSSHIRVTRALRPVFILDNHYSRRVRRYLRQVLQSLPPILDMLVLLLFVMLLFSCLGFYLFSEHLDNPYFSTLSESFVNLFVLLTTGNFPDVMMPAYARSKWYALFFVTYLIIVLYFMMNLMLAVVYASFSSKEKEKLKKLLLHRQTACQHAFRLLISRKHSNSVNFKRFSGGIKHLDSYRSKRDTYLIFRLLNVSRTGVLNLSEFQHVLDALPIVWKKKKDSCKPYFNSYPKHFRFICNLIRKIMLWQSTQYFIYFQTISEKTLTL